MRQKSCDTPAMASAEAGEVLLDGPDGIAFSLTPAAARDTGERLIDAAGKAGVQGNTPSEAHLAAAIDGSVKL